MKSKTYVMNGKNYNSLLELASELGLSRVRPQQFDKYGITVVDGTQSSKKVDESKVEDTKTEVEVKAKVKTSDIKVPDTTEDDTKVDDEVKVEEVKVEEVKLDTKDATEVKTEDKPKNKEISKFEEYAHTLRKSSVEELVKLASEAGLDTQDHVTDDRIRRMQLTMSLKSKFFPGEKLESKKPSNFKSLPLDELRKLASDNNVEYKEYSDDRITRMWLTNKLVAAGVEPKKES